MNNPQEKAREIIIDFLAIQPIDYITNCNHAHTCALLHARRIRQQASQWGVISVIGYWDDVIKEIETKIEKLNQHQTETHV